MKPLAVAPRQMPRSGIREVMELAAELRDRLKELERSGYLIDLKVFAGLQFLPEAQR